MTTIRTATKRALALLALAVIAIVVAVMIASATSGDDDGGKARQPVGKEARGQGKSAGNGEKAEGQGGRESYVVESGDTLSSIAEETGTTVEELQRLNPDIDPQILVSGQKLKLR